MSGWLFFHYMVWVECICMPFCLLFAISHSSDVRPSSTPTPTAVAIFWQQRQAVIKIFLAFPLYHSGTAQTYVFFWFYSRHLSLWQVCRSLLSRVLLSVYSLNEPFYSCYNIYNSFPMPRNPISDDLCHVLIHGCWITHHLVYAPSLSCESCYFKWNIWELFI